MRLIDAEKLENYAHEPEFGTNDEIVNWIGEISIPLDLKSEYEEELKELCWKVLNGCMNVIKTEPTAYDVDKVVERLKVNSMYMDGEIEAFVTLDDAIEIVLNK